jgi:hypothetical protein
LNGKYRFMDEENLLLLVDENDMQVM